MAICWIGKINKGGISDEFVSGVDLAPTILDAVGIHNKGQMVGISLLPYLQKKRKDTGRTMVLQEENVMLLHVTIIGDIRAVH